MKNKPSEKISRAVVGEIIAPSNLPPALAALARRWEGLSYDERVADAKQRPLPDRLQILQSVGSLCKNAIQLVREFLSLLEACCDELSQPGRRVPVEGKPTWTEFVTTTFGFSARRIQQLLADGSQSRPSSKPVTRPDKKRTGSGSVNERTEQIMPLALKLAQRVVELGLAAQLPEAEAILNILDTTREVHPVPASGSDESDLTPVVQDRNDSLLPTPATRVEEVVSDTEFQPLPNCYVCGTGIEFCPFHEPQHKKLMTERGLDDLDAADVLRNQYARRARELSKAACRALRLPCEEPDWFRVPVMRRIAISTPNVMAALRRLNR